MADLIYGPGITDIIRDFPAHFNMLTKYISINLFNILEVLANPYIVSNLIPQM